jgi:signal transduction histidine kinase
MAASQSRDGKETGAPPRELGGAVTKASSETRDAVHSMLDLPSAIEGAGLTERQRAQAVDCRVTADSLLGMLSDASESAGLAEAPVPEAREFDAAALLEALVDVYGLMAREKGLAFHYRLEGPMPARALGSPEVIDQVLCRLLDQAIRATQTGAVELRVTFATADAASGATAARLRMVIEDSGLGFTEEFLAAWDGGPAAWPGSLHEATNVGLILARYRLESIGGTLRFANRLEGGGRAVVEMELPCTAPPDGTVPA